MTFNRRRKLLRGAGVAAVAGLAGCIFGGSDDGGSDGTYDVVMKNEITESDLSATHDFSNAKKAVLTVEVDRIREGENEVLFERTLELGAGESRTFEDAVEVAEDGSACAVNVDIEPFHDGPRSPGQTRTGTRFTPGGENAPADGTIVASVFDGEDGAPLVPIVDLDV